MSKRGKCCRGLLIAFRVIQFLLSATALACGIWICYVMFTMSDTASMIDTFIESLLDEGKRSEIENTFPDVFDFQGADEIFEGAAKVLDKTLVPVLHVLEGTPARAILISLAALWSVAVIIYLHFASSTAKKATHQLLPSEPNTPHLPNTYRPRRNRRSVRVCLSILTILFWVIALICACMLAAEFGIILLSGGIEMKTAFTVIKVLLRKALGAALNDDDNGVLRALDIIDDIFTIGALAILAIAASVICGAVEIISLIVACCTSGKVKQKPQQMQQLHQQQYPQSYQQVRSGEADEALMNRNSATSYSSNPNYNYSYSYAPNPDYNPNPNPNQNYSYNYSYSNTPEQMKNQPVVAYTPDHMKNNAVVTYTPDHTKNQPVVTYTPTTTHAEDIPSPPTPMPIVGWGRDQARHQPQMTNPVHGTPSIVISPVWDHVAGPPPPQPPHPPQPPQAAPPPQRFYAYHHDMPGPGYGQVQVQGQGQGHGQGQVRRKPVG